MSTTELKGISPESFAAIYGMAWQYWGRADASFEEAALANYMGGSAGSIQDVKFFCENFCDRFDVSSDQAMYKLGDSAKRVYDQIATTAAAAAAPSDTAAEEPAADTPPSAIILGADAADAGRGDGLPNPRHYSPGSRAQPLAKIVMPSASGAHQVIAPPPPKPPQIPTPIAEKMAELDTLSLLREARALKNAGENDKFNVAVRILRTRDDLPNNPYFRPPQINHPVRQDEVGIDITPLCAKFGYGDEAYIYLATEVHIQVNNDGEWKLENFVQTLCDRKLRSNRPWRPLLLGRTEHDIVVERVRVHDNTEIVWVSARATGQ